MKTCLLIDDDALYLSALKRSLERRGYRVETAMTSVEAIAAATAHAPDFALVDLKLAEDSGLDLVGPLREAHAATRIVLVTGYASVATAVEAIKRGADHYLAKPTTVDAILRAIGEKEGAEPEPEDTMTPLSRLEWEHIQQAMIDSQGNISAAARLLGMHRRSLQRKLAKKPGRERRSPDELD
ncbi:response regulator transcription factor [Dokdonella immobilis]|uniref:Two-component system, response regulator RegA n=1 Tax=Dokdonella immobilis TaxID=578942 RepID=A0A1I4Y7C5_9GAMM|nr:response regulator [Dokdonella immobilis]SFN33885.1 two-component system, response regulator RegA [Dokdonella immobilis]